MIVLLVGLSIHYGGVSNAPLLFIFVITAMVAVAVTRGISLKERVTIFSRGAGSTNLMLMVWIFMLAGAFAATAKEMGAAGAMVDLTLRILPANLRLRGYYFLSPSPLMSYFLSPFKYISYFYRLIFLLDLLKLLIFSMFYE